MFYPTNYLLFCYHWYAQIRFNNLANCFSYELWDTFLYLFLNSLLND